MPDSNSNKLSEQPQSSPQNYFERCNEEFDRAIASGKVLESENLIEEISTQNKTDFFKKIFDAIQAPQEALKWFSKTLMMEIAGTWLGKLTGIGKKIKEAKEKITEIIHNPFKIIKDTLASLENFEIFKKLGIDLNNFEWAKGVKGEMIASAGALGASIIGLGKLGEYLKQNPELAHNFPTDLQGQTKWWKELFEKLNISELYSKLIDVLTGKKKITDLFSKDGKEKKSTAATSASSSTSPEKPQEDSFSITEENGQIEHSKYGKLAPRETVVKDYRNQLEAWFLEIKSFVIDNQTVLLAGGLAAGSVAAIREIALSSTKFSFESLLLIAKLPFKSKKSFLISSLLGLSAFLIYEKSFAISYQGKEYLPDSKDKMKDFITDKLSVMKSKLPEEIETVSDSTISSLSELLFDPRKKLDEYLPKIEKAAFNLAEGGIEKVALSNLELIKKKNLEGISQMRRNLEIYFKKNHKQFDSEIPEKFLNQLALLEQKISNDEKLTPELVDSLLEENAFKLGINIIYDNGYFVWFLVDPESRIELPEQQHIKFGIDGNLPEDKQVNMSFEIGDVSTYERVASSITSEFRRGINNWLMTEVENEDQQNQAIKEYVLSGKWAIVGKGGAYFLANLAEGFAVKYIEMPAKLFHETFLQFFSEEGANWDEFAADYGRGIIPVTILAFAKVAYSPTKILNFFSIGNAIKIAAYPVTGGFNTSRALWDVYSHKRHGGNFSDYITKPRDQVLSELNSKKNYLISFYHSKKIDIGLTGSTSISGITQQLSKYYEAKSICYEMLYGRTNKNENKAKIKNILEGTILESESFIEDEPDDIIKKVNDIIYHSEAKLEAIKRIQLLERAKINLNSENIDEAKKLLQKAGYSEISNIDELNSKLEELKNFAINSGKIRQLQSAQSRIKSDQTKDAKRILRQAGFDENMSLEEITAKIDELTKSGAEEVPKELKYLENRTEYQQLRRSRPTTASAKTPETRIETQTEISRQIEAEITGKNQDEIAKLIQSRDAEIAGKLDDFDRQITALTESSQGNITKEIAAKIDDLKIAHDLALSEHLGLRGEYLKHLEIETAKTHNIETAENYATRMRERVMVRTPKLRTRLKTQARALAGHTLAGAAIAAGFTLLFIGAKEALADDTETVDLSKKTKRSKEKKSESNESQIESQLDSPAENDEKPESSNSTEKNPESSETLELELAAVKQYMISKERLVYKELNAILEDLQNIEKISEEKFTEVVNRTAAEHDKAISHIKNVLQQNAEKIAAYFKKYPEDIKKHFHQGNHFILDLNSKKNSLEFKYADGEEYKKIAYFMFDDRKNNRKDYLAGSPPGTGTRLLEAGERAIPGYGFYLDYRDAWRAGQRGQYGEMWANIGWGTVGVVSDVALGLTIFTGVSGAVGAGLKALRVTSITGRTAKIMQTTAVITKVAPAAVGLTVATYQTFKSPFNKTFEIKL